MTHHEKVAVIKVNIVTIYLITRYRTTADAGWGLFCGMQKDTVAKHSDLNKSAERNKRGFK
ncbi:MAG: hypothetical protein CMI13_14135 [Oleibacter sp.]|nr:hypothetical protein [Thalassolituus sp.]|tara:strand:- start:551 stop:733 length:183 start_codon:yes stop_codon:yes gene_type:complete